LGLGLALPWMAVAAAPRLAQALPRPGRWMIRLKIALGVALLATALWLISILDLQIGRVATATIALLLAAVLLVLALKRFLPPRWHVGARATVALLAVAAIVVPAGLPVGAAAPEPREAPAADLWRGFAEDKIASLVTAGNTVFVDVTADWCLSCQVNKALVLNSAEIGRLLEAPDVVAMKADWTRPDPAIGTYLSKFGRYGIPFNAVYGPKTPDGILLPEILTKDAVRQALAKAGG
ncbi:MAG: thioredoxin family protein, partial [Pseudomonadota bacterium]